MSQASFCQAILRSQANVHFATQKKRFRSDAQIRHLKPRSLRQCGMQIVRHGGNSYSRHSPGSEDETHRDIADTALLIQTGRAAKKCSSSGG
jgi:hypothetical protein